MGVAIYDPTRIIHGDIIPDNPKGNGIGYYPFRGLGNKKVSIYASSGETNAGESAFNLLCFEKQNKWCEDKTQNPWVIFELNDYYDINKLVFRDVAPYESGNGNVPEYWIYTSTAGVNDNDWVLALHKTDQGSIDVKVDSFSTPIKSRYIKFVASRGVRTDNGATENAIRIYGFDIFGTLAETVDRGDLVSVGKSVLDFYDAKNYYDQPLHLLDGNLNADNFWQFDRAGSADSLKYVIIDLENEYEIEKFKLYDAGNFDSKSYNLSGYKIYVSEEKPDLDLITPLIDKNTVWRKVVDVTDVKLQNTKTNVIEPVTSRYVKLEIPLSRSSVLNRIYQFEVYKKNTLNGNSQMSLSNIKVWPNYLKAGETLNFEMNESGKLSVYSVQGNLVLKSDLHKNINNCDVDLPVGCYVANINTNHKSKRFKFVVH
ncbi:MAG: discoidin domain-containing protein [Paludibacter sp.]|nr:discoidin domain-containing protein [Paludibacter sp.]